MREQAPFSGGCSAEHGERASGVHTACAGRGVHQNHISGSLPTEIGQMSGLVYLYGPFSWDFGALLREQAPCAGGCYTEHGMGEDRRSALCMCWQVRPAEQHLRLAAHRAWPAKQTRVSVLALALLGLGYTLRLYEGAGTLCWWLLCRAWHRGGRVERTLRTLHVLAGASAGTAFQARCQPRSAS